MLSQCYHSVITALSRSVAFRALIIFGVHAAFRSLSLSLSLSHSLDEKRFSTVGRSRCTLCACGIPLSLSLSLDVLCVPAAFRSLPLSLAGVAGFPSPSSLCVSRSPCWLNPCVCVCVCAWLLQVAATSTMEGSLMALLADPSRKLLTPRECRAYAAGSGSGRSLSLQLGPLGKPLAAISPCNNGSLEDRKRVAVDEGEGASLSLARRVLGKSTCSSPARRRSIYFALVDSRQTAKAVASRHVAPLFLAAGMLLGDTGHV